MTPSSRVILPRVVWLMLLACAVDGCLPIYTIPPLHDYQRFDMPEYSGELWNRYSIYGALSDCTLFRPNRAQLYKYWWWSVGFGDEHWSGAFTFGNGLCMELCATKLVISSYLFGFDTFAGLGHSLFTFKNQPWEGMSWYTGGLRSRLRLSPYIVPVHFPVMLQSGYRISRAVGVTVAEPDFYLWTGTWQVGVEVGHFSVMYSNPDISSMPPFRGEYSYLRDTAWRYLGIEPNQDTHTRFHMLSVGISVPMEE